MERRRVHGCWTGCCEPAGGECKAMSSRPKAQEAKSQGKNGCSLLIWLGRWMRHRKLRRDLPKVSY